jgi:hypothetical protein
MTPAHAEMIERLRQVLNADERIESAWLSGSLGRGTGDPWSDVDVTCVVEEGDIAACVAEYAGPRNPVGSTVHQIAPYGRVAANTATDLSRYDLSFMTPAQFRHVDPATVQPLVRATRPPTGVTRPNQLDGAKLAANAAEFIRIFGLLPVAIGRREWIVAIEGAGLMRRAIVDLMIEANGRAHERGGVKKLNYLLTDEQRTALEATLAIEPHPEALIAANLAMAGLFLPLARRLVAERGGAWPQAFESATWAHLKRELDIDPPPGCGAAEG